MGWGPDMLTVEAASPARAKEIAGELGQLGFKAIENEDEAYAGMLSLSKNPAAFQAKIATFDISRRRWDEQIVPFLWALGTLLLWPGLYTERESGMRWVMLPLGVLSVFLLVWDGLRIWGWRLELLSEGLRLRQRFQWQIIPWEQIQKVESQPLGTGNRERVILKLASHASEDLGTFNCAFSRNLRDRLRYELTQRQHTGNRAG